MFGIISFDFTFVWVRPFKKNLEGPLSIYGTLLRCSQLGLHSSGEKGPLKRLKYMKITLHFAKKSLLGTGPLTITVDFSPPWREIKIIFDMQNSPS